jgi:hypothetical protein
MKLPIVSRKKYEIALSNLKVLNEGRLQSSKRNIELQKENIELKDTNVELSNQLETKVLKLKEKTIELANIKRWLKRNNIEYKPIKEKK